ncbi:MAG: hypothetical protein DDT39_00345 [Firmicutes bacterium]|nr:hypothetical protein [candidate division NPL-UPA2 bacterium]MBT9153688.1 hypothetical protein [candidate division NPL-UPA2 bacterium]
MHYADSLKTHAVNNLLGGLFGFGAGGDGQSKGELHGAVVKGVAVGANLHYCFPPLTYCFDNIGKTNGL